MTQSEKINQLIISIWKEELAHDDFDCNSDFFELGGSSLKLISILDKLQKSFPEGKLNSLTVIELFDHSTIDALSALIQQKLVA